MSVTVDHITVKGFRSLKALENLELRSINILVGANGSGKSNFIALFGFLRAIRQGRLQNYVTAAGGADKLMYFGSRATSKIEITISFNDETNGYRLTLGATDEDNLYPIQEAATFWANKKTYIEPYFQPLNSRDGGKEAGISSPDAVKTASWVRALLGSWRVYHFHDTSQNSPMRRPAQVDDNAFLRPDGSNLPAFLYFLLKKHPGSYQFIRRTVQRVAPYFDDFSLAPLRLNENLIKLEWRHKSSDSYFDAAALSDGTLRFIVLTTLFLQPKELLPSLILVDEPELGLHPYAVQMLGSLIRQAAVNTQVLIATQSPQLLDNFDPEDLLVADRTDAGTQIRRLQADTLSSWLDEYSLGQLWEKNEFAGRPA